MKMKKLLTTGLAGLMALTTGLTAVQAQEAVKIGVNLELTGAAAPYSVPAVDAFNLFVEQVNADGGVLDGKQLELVVLDNTTDTTEGISVATRLADQGVDALIGPNASSVVKAVKSTIGEVGLPTVLPATTADDITLDDAGTVLPNLFRTAYEDSYQGSAGAQFVFDTLEAKNVVLVVDQAMDYSTGIADAFVAQFEKLGGTVVDTQSYQSGDTDFNALATTLLGLEFDAIYMPGYYTETGLVVKQLRELGVMQPVVGGDGFASDTFVELAGEANANDVYYTTHYYVGEGNDRSDAFAKAFEEKFGKAPDTFAALGYDAIALLVDAINRAGSTDAEAVNQALAETVDFEGVTGTFSVDEKHNPVKPALMVKLENGQVVDATEVSAE